MEQSNPHDDVVEQTIRSLVEEVRTHIDSITTAKDAGREALGKLGSYILPRLWALVLGDPPPEYTPEEARSFANGRASDTELACIEVRRGIRTLEFWMARTYRAWGCRDLEQFAYRLESLLKERAPDPALFERLSSPEDLVRDEEDARWFARAAREYPGRLNQRTAQVTEIVRRNPTGLTTADVTQLINAESAGRTDPGSLS